MGHVQGTSPYYCSLIDQQHQPDSSMALLEDLMDLHQSSPFLLDDETI